MERLFLFEIPLFTLIALYLLYPEFFLRARPIDNKLTSFIKDGLGGRFQGFYAVKDRQLNCYLLPRKKVVFTSALMDALTPREVLAVVLHEVGHIRHRHLYFRVPFVMIYTYILVLPLSLAYAFLGIDRVLFLVSLVFWAGWYLVLTRTVSRWFSKKMAHQELEADRYAKDQGLGPEFAEGLRKISAQAPHSPSIPFRVISWIWGFILGPNPTHPTIEERIARLEG